MLDLAKQIGDVHRPLLRQSGRSKWYLPEILRMLEHFPEVVVFSKLDERKKKNQRIMLRKRSRPVQKDNKSKGHHLMLDSSSDSCFPSHGLVQKVRNSSLFTVPGLFVGFSNKVLLDSETVRSPRSPLDLICLSSIGSSLLGSPRSPGGGSKPRSWDSSRVGLSSLVDALNDEVKPREKVAGVSESRNILFGSQMRMNISSPISQLTCLRDDSLGAAPKSLPKDYGIASFPFMGSSPKPWVVSSKLSSRSKGVEFELGEIGIARSGSEEIRQSASPLTRFSCHDSKSSSEVLLRSEAKKSLLDSPAVNGSSSHELIGLLLSPSEIEQSEDYTCIISHGPNPKTTHFFGDCLLDSHIIQSPGLDNKLRNEGKRSAWLLKPSADLPPCSADDFLSFCFSCKKRLEEGHDIYIYRGEKAFCSSDCRDQEILIEEEMEKAISSSDSRGSSFHEEGFS